MRTSFLLSNPRFIDTLALRHGIPLRELDDFRQDVLLSSVRRKDTFDPSRGSISTYAGNFVVRCALDWHKTRRPFPTLVDPHDLESF